MAHCLICLNFRLHSLVETSLFFISFLDINLRYAAYATADLRSFAQPLCPVWNGNISCPLGGSEWRYR